MKITIKTITQLTFQIDVEPTDTISDMKKKIAAEKGEGAFAVEGQKLIYNGKVLADTQTVEEVKIDPAKFVVVMMTRTKAAQPSQPAPTEAPAPEAPAASTEPTAAAAAPPAAEPASDSSQQLTREQEETVTAIVAMGYPRDRVGVILALRASFFNGDRAVEYLCSGVPLEEGSGSGNQEEGEGESVGQDMPEALEFLRDMPQFEQLRELVQSNPQILPQIIQQIATSNPALMEAIQSNQEEFLNLINATDSESGSAGGGGESGQRGGDRQRGIAIEVTAAEREAIERLKSMGFPEHLVIEGYFACDKNEDLAVNYILARLDEAAEELAGLDPSSGGAGGQ